jgi:uncharacterized protein YegL
MAKYLFMVAFIMSVAFRLAAQPFTLDKKIKPVELKLEQLKLTGKDSLKNGKAAFVTVEQQVDTAYYFAKGFSTYQPVYFSITADNKADAPQIKAFLVKQNWRKPDRICNFKNGVAEERFRTEGSLGLMVISKKRNLKYHILVWAGKEILDSKTPLPK